MLERINLKSSSVKNENKLEIKKLREKFTVLQQTIKENKVPVIILLEGWGASGKGSMISEMITDLDPRSFKVYTVDEADIAEARKPLLWRFWNKIPEYGRISILDRSWYIDISTNKVEQKLSDKEFKDRIDNINIFERQLTDDGYLIIKLFLHISQKEQKDRLEKLESNKNTAWRVSEHDKKRNKNYDEYYNAYDEMCECTNTQYAPWHIIGCHDKSNAICEMFKVLVESISNAVSKKAIAQNQNEIAVPLKHFTLLNMPMLNEINLNKSITDEKYDEELKKLQKVLSKLQNKLYRAKIPVIISFEGWDAAGKGGAIKRVAAALDPRGYEAIPVAAPDKYELSHHYLWRFWRNIAKTGHTAIFDRSWYGRVMVERIEGFTPKERWEKAYQEINEFENQLTEWGAIVIKFWLQIDKKEQLERFNERQSNPEKQWKITEEDWRNREKWDDYEIAVNEMLQKTSTDFAPWYVIEAKDKKFARIKILKLVIKAIKNCLNEE